ncbi:DUF6197 family protein [Streptomyces scopuliridis]|uniref:Uncharacterized protein n=1 Tax=Streptomyces scopuliridis RB72 TaxID=1440053 RepID=A0A2T7SP17_9ACTN|nr:hypothetical protein Y717_10620 [Streptomyces scopuliridis RB72]
MDVEVPRPTTVSAVFRAAARVIAANGHYQGDFVPDVFDREMCVPHFLRPMSIVAALKTAVTGDPHRTSLLADEAIAVLALRLEVNGEMGPFYGDIFSLEEHIAAWGDVPGRTVESVVAVLYAAGDAAEVSA